LFGGTALRQYICTMKKIKKMRKLIVFTVAAMCTFSAVKAQDQSSFRFSAGPELSFATGAFSNTHSIGIGGTVQAEVSLQEHLYGTATFGIIAYNGKSSGAGLKYKGETILPLRVGAKYFLSGGVYGAAQIGVGFLNNGGGTAFAYSPQIGYEFKTRSDKAVDASFKYDGYSKNGTLGAIGFRVAYIF
jgi:hypothetical protein